MTTTEGAKPRLLLPGPNITQTVFIECGSMYRADGPVKMKPVGETKFVRWDRGNGCRGSQLARRWREGFEPLVPAQNGHRSETASCRVCQGTHSLNGSAFPHIREFGSSSPARPVPLILIEEKRFRVDPCLRLGLAVAREASVLRRSGRGVATFRSGGPFGEGQSAGLFSEASTCPVHSDCPGPATQGKSTAHSARGTFATPDKPPLASWGPGALARPHRCFPSRSW
jgi:hypothetical protein